MNILRDGLWQARQDYGIFYKLEFKDNWTRSVRPFKIWNPLRKVQKSARASLFFVFIINLTKHIKQTLGEKRKGLLDFVVSQQSDSCVTMKKYQKSRLTLTFFVLL